MRNKVIILSLSLVMVLCSSFSVFGATVVDFIMSEPSTSDTQGYLAVTNPDHSARNVFYWSITPYKASEELNNVSIPCMSIILNDDSITFTALHTGNARVTLTRVYNGRHQTLLMSRQFTTSTEYTYTGMSDIEYYCYEGNIGVVDDNITSDNNYLTVRWGSESNFQDEFDEVINELVTIDTHLLNIYTRLGTLNGYVDGLEGALGTTNSHLSSIKSYVDSVETYLQTIIGHINAVEPSLSDINSNLEFLQKQLDDLIDICDSMDVTLKEINSKLANIIGMLGDEPTDPLDDSDIEDLESDEDEVLDDDSQLIDDLSLSFGNAFDVVWDLISQAWQSNSKVFTVVIMCLTIGILKLILNR